jgi:integrase/recombinase XerC
MNGAALVPITLPLVVPTGRNTLRSYVPSFLGCLEFVREMPQTTIASYGDALRQFLAFTDAHGLIYVEQVRPAAVEAFGAMLRHQGKNIATVNHRRSVLASFFRFLEREGAATGNPAKLAYGMKAPRRLVDYLNASQRHRVLETLSHDHTVRGLLNLAIVATGILTGLRVAEAVALRTTDLDGEEGLIHVLHGKGDVERYAPLIDYLREVLDRYMTRARPDLLGAVPPGVVPPDALFISRLGKPFTTRGIYYLVVRVVSPIIGRHAHPHQLRHSFASMAIEGGAQMPALQKAMGHQNAATTSRYVHLPNKEYVRAFARALTGEAAVAKPAEPVVSVSVPPLPVDRPVPPAHPFAELDVREGLRARRRARRGSTRASRRTSATRISRGISRGREAGR